MRRLPSHGFLFGSPPKLQGHEIEQLQLSATVAVMCQFGSAARGAVNITRKTATMPRNFCMAGEYSPLEVFCMIRLFAFGTLVALLGTPSPASAQAAATPFVSTDWLQQHLSDPNVRIVTTGDRGRYQQGHIPGARFLEHMD